MELGKTLYLIDREDWRSWLAKNHDKEKEIWLIYYRKSSGKPRLSYNDAVEEALCYGWIDSIQKGIDSERFAQRFSPRKAKSVLSEANRERIRKLIKEGRMTQAGLDAVSDSFDPEEESKGTWSIAPDILSALKSNQHAWKNFQTLPEGYKKVRIGFIESRRRHGDEMFQRSLRHFISMTAKNKKFGIMK
ncbi:MAG: YdeI/OmpD-associated family protein [Methanomassiliicoccales archaeon]|nr:YdeI/OmpD-associated family protein [Methanomassiliicoccales archaeon]